MELPAIISTLLIVLKAVSCDDNDYLSSDSYPPAQEPYPPAQGPYPPAQGPYPPAQGPYLPTQGPYPPAQGPYPSDQTSYQPAQTSYQRVQSSNPSTSQEIAQVRIVQYPWHDDKIIYIGQNGYQGSYHPDLPVLETPAEAAIPAAFGGLSILWVVAAWVLAHAVALGVGVVLAIGVCKLTPLCSVHWLDSHAHELRGLASSGKLSRAAKMLSRALTKYEKKA